MPKNHITVHLKPLYHYNNTSSHLHGFCRTQIENKIMKEVCFYKVSKNKI